MKKTILALLACALFFAVSANAKMTHKWDEEHYAKGDFKVKKHDYPKAKTDVPPEKMDENNSESIKIDHKGRIYREKDYPKPRHTPENRQ